MLKRNRDLDSLEKLLHEKRSVLKRDDCGVKVCNNEPEKTEY